jgi:hypothetical protein
MHPQPVTDCGPRAMGNFKHGLTGRIFFFNEAETSAYDSLFSGIKEALSPADALEDQIVKSLVDDQWLNRAASLESAIFSEGAEKFAASWISAVNIRRSTDALSRFSDQ